MRSQKDPPSPRYFRIFVARPGVDWKLRCRRRANRLRVSALCSAVLGVFHVAVVAGSAAIAPVISAIPDQVTYEDEPILHVPFTVWDADTPLEQLRFSTVFSFTNNIVIGGTGSNRWLSIYPPLDSFGLASVSITVSDETGLRATASFHVQVNPLNDAPRFSSIPDQTALKGQGALSVPFSVYDPDSQTSEIRLTAWSSRQTVANNSGLRLAAGTSPTSRTLVIALPTNGVAGSTAITIQADDHQSSNTVSFILNVLTPDFARSSNSIPAAADNFQPVWGDFNGDGLLDLLVSTTQIYTNAGNGSFSAGIQLTGGIVASNAAAADFDGDGNLDLLFAGGGTRRLFRNSGGTAPTFIEVPINWPVIPLAGSRLFWADM